MGGPVYGGPGPGFAASGQAPEPAHAPVGRPHAAVNAGGQVIANKRLCHPPGEIDLSQTHCRLVWVYVLRGRAVSL